MSGVKYHSGTGNPKYTLTTKGTKIHEKKPIHFYHKDAEHTEEIQIHFTMKNMKVMKLNPVAPVA